MKKVYKVQKIFIFLLIAIIAFLLFCVGCTAKGISGNEWVLMQMSYLDELELFAENMDEVFSLYVIGAIGATDFLTEIDLLKEEYSIMDSVYKAEKQSHPILPESNSYAAQKGSEGFERVREILLLILNDAVVDGSPLSPEEAAYMYMAHKEELTDNLAVYLTAVQYITAAETEGSENGVN